jgi:hypothetical protein
MGKRLHGMDGWASIEGKGSVQVIEDFFEHAVPDCSGVSQ